MTAIEIALAGYLAFGQLTGNSYEAIAKHSGLQVIHADGAVTLRLNVKSPLKVDTSFLGCVA